MKKLNSLIGATVADVKVKKGSYGLHDEVIITTTDGAVHTIDCKGQDHGEAGQFPGLNFSSTLNKFDQIELQRRRAEDSRPPSIRGIKKP